MGLIRACLLTAACAGLASTCSSPATLDSLCSEADFVQLAPEKNWRSYVIDSLTGVADTSHVEAGFLLRPR
jgi:hypothetical protein